MRRTSARVLLGLLIGSGLTAPSQARDTPFLLWSVAGIENTVYLLGSVHLLGSETLAWSPALEAAYADAEKLVFAIDLDDLDPGEVQQAALQLGLLPPGETLEGVLGAQTFAAMAAHARDLGLDPDRLQSLRPWLAALTLVQAQMSALGLSREAGVEQRFLARASRDGKDVLGLETPEQGLSALASLSMERQREFMAYTLIEADTMATQLDEMMAAWKSGDTAQLTALLDRGFAEFPDLYGPLTVARNREWTAILADLLDDPDDYLVVVGALHLVGEDSVIDLLEARGYEVLRR